MIRFIFLLAVLAPTPHTQLMTWPVFASYLCGPGVGHVTCGEGADLNGDHAVDLIDLAKYQDEYRCIPDVGCGRITQWTTEP